MRGQFVFRPPAPIGNPIKDQEKKIKDLEASIAAYENLLKNPSVHNAEQLEDLLEEAQDQLERARLELRRLGGADLDETTTPGQGRKSVSTSQRGNIVKPPQPRFEESEGGNAPQVEVLPSEEEKEKESSKRSRPPSREPQVPQVPEKRIHHLSEEAEMLNQWTRELNSIVSRALAPLMRTLGIVAARLRYDDVRPLLRWKQDAPLVEDRLNLIESAESVEEFVSKNSPVVGTQLLRLYIGSYKPPKEEEEFAQSNAMIGEGCFDLDIDNPAAVSEWATRNSRNRIESALRQLNASETEIQFAPAWAFEVMGSGIFRALLSVSCLGAFEAAHSQVNRIPNCATFTMKELICSPSVSDQFAFLVSSVYLLSGDQLRNVQGGNGSYSRNSTYLNLARMRDQMGLAVYTCKIWFESVFAVPNPLLRRFQEKKQERLARFRQEMTPEMFQEFMVKEVENAPPARVKRIVDALLFFRVSNFWDNTDFVEARKTYETTTTDAATSDLVKKQSQKTFSNVYSLRLQEIFNAEQLVNSLVGKITDGNVNVVYDELKNKLESKQRATQELDAAFRRFQVQQNLGTFKIVFRETLLQFYTWELNDWFRRSKAEASASFEEKLNLYGNMLPKRELIYRG